MYQNTLYKTNEKIINLLKASGFRTITTGDDTNYDQQKRDVQYPQAHIIVDGGVINEQTTDLFFKIMLMDKLDVASNEFIEYGNDNFIDIQQDLIVRFSTVLRQLDKKYLTTYDSNFIGNEFKYGVNFAYFKETQPELLAGIVATFTITVPLMADDCATYYSIEGMPSRPQNYVDYVPYVGANKDVYLNQFNLLANKVIVSSGTTDNFIKGNGDLDYNKYSHTLFLQTELKTIENTTTETSLIGNGIGNRSILANKLYLGKTYRSNIKGLISGVKGDTATIRIKIGNQTIIQSIAEIPSTLNNTYCESNLTYLCVGITGTTAQILCEGKTTIIGGVGLNTTYSRSLIMLAPITIDNSIDNQIDVTYQWSVASALNKLTNTMAELEEIN
jgi:hypothetical protein